MEVRSVESEPRLLEEEEGAEDMDDVGEGCDWCCCTDDCCGWVICITILLELVSGGPVPGTNTGMESGELVTDGSDDDGGGDGGTRAVVGWAARSLSAILLIIRARRDDPQYYC